MNKLGLQLACVQDKLVSQPQQTLEYIYNLGLRHIELPEIRLLKRLHPVLTGMGFKVHSSYFASPYITKNWEPYLAFGKAKPKIETFSELIEEASKYNLSYLVCPDIFPQDRGDLEWYSSFSEWMNEAGKACQEAGIQLCYHNHNFEFQPVENTSPFEVMLETFDPELVKFEVDIFWLSIAGVNIQNFIKEYQEQIALLHLGDLGSDAPQSYRAITLGQKMYQSVGKGKIDFRSFLQLKETADIPYYFLNLEQSENILEDLKTSVEYLKNL
ncbi:sugar phosphate isomerase/epimerase family protein [Catalinimonas niigatensis]|uniref:sugar phosphate isomerase/epimerase family protein n=1 Tax=Catalinimonas niigatensis TaxID=1397264 RepID=UPI0026658A00|nr:sugar phosphate isomerase/epimerase [Catalinimonas niigatensis]WPP51152.1 sugar phosphate isomerase/epimerase [Catalinimonas niigatensis]